MARLFMRLSILINVICLASGICLWPCWPRTNLAGSKDNPKAFQCDATEAFQQVEVRIPFKFIYTQALVDDVRKIQLNGKKHFRESGARGNKQASADHVPTIGPHCFN